MPFQAERSFLPTNIAGAVRKIQGNLAAVAGCRLPDTSRTDTHVWNYLAINNSVNPSLPVKGFRVPDSVPQKH